MFNSISNKSMEKILIELDSQSVQLSVKTVQALEKLLIAGFVEWDGCILLNIESNLINLPDRFVPTDLIIDRTQYEAVTNYVFISELTDETEDEPSKALIAAKEISTKWATSIKEKYPSDSFRIVISQDEMSTSIRLYKFREKDIKWINEENIDGYQHEALTVIRV